VEKFAIDSTALADRFIAADPSCCAPSKKVTVPVGAPIASTLAVRVIVEVFVAGFIEAASEVLVGILVTVCVYGLDEPLEKFASPP
jgi:hypothetical protein